MPSDQHRAVSRKAGQLSHLKSAAHEWTRDEAREAGRKGGLAKHANQRAKQDQEDGMTNRCPWCVDFDPTALSNRGASHVACPACLLKLEQQTILAVEQAVEEAAQARRQ